MDENFLKNLQAAMLQYKNSTQGGQSNGGLQDFMSMMAGKQNEPLELGFNKGTLGALGQGIQGLGGLASIYFGNKQLGMAEDQYNTSKEFGNRNIANQAQTINNALESRYRATLAAKGIGTEGGQGKESLESYLNRSKVNGSAIA